MPSNFRFTDAMFPTNFINLVIIIKQQKSQNTDCWKHWKEGNFLLPVERGTTILVVYLVQEFLVCQSFRVKISDSSSVPNSTAFFKIFQETIIRPLSLPM